MNAKNVREDLKRRFPNEPEYILNNDSRHLFSPGYFLQVDPHGNQNPL